MHSYLQQLVILSLLLISCKKEVDYKMVSVYQYHEDRKMVQINQYQSQWQWVHTYNSSSYLVDERTLTSDYTYYNKDFSRYKLIRE